MRFILLDRILEIKKGREGSFLKNVSQSEDYFTDHFPESPIMPGVLILESFDQASQFLVSAGHDFACYPELRQVRRVAFKHYVLPGDQLLVHLSVVSEENEKVAIAASAETRGRIAAEATLLFDLIPGGRDEEAQARCGRIKRLYEALSADPFETAWENLAGRL